MLFNVHSIRSIKIAKWCNSFAMINKPNNPMSFCLDPIRLNQVVIIPIHKNPKINDILPKLRNPCYMTIIDAWLGYHHLNPDKKSPYLTTFACQFDRYIFFGL